MAGTLQNSLRTVRERETFLQDLIDAVPDGIRVIADDFSVLKTNRAYCEQLGMTMDQAIKLPCYRSSHGRSEPCVPTLVTCPLAEVKKSSEPIKTLHQHVRADGSGFLVEVFAAPVRAKVDGVEKTLVVESIRDAAKDVQYSHEQRLAELGQLAAGVAHEVHNPLASMRIGLQALLRDAKDETIDNSHLVDQLDTIDAEIDTCIDVTERLLKLSVPPGDQQELVAVNAAVRDTMSLLELEAEQLGVVVELVLNPGDPRVMAAENDLRMVIFNLAQNAFHAMPKGGTLTVRTDTSNSDVRLSFEDTGVGIDADDLRHVFEPFFSRRADGVKGTGLGLPICKTIIERHGGRIELISEPGEGTGCTVNLPNVDFQNAQGKP
jgi:PAS domain S-box-containing protein